MQFDVQLQAVPLVKVPFKLPDVQVHVPLPVPVVQLPAVELPAVELQFDEQLQAVLLIVVPFRLPDVQLHVALHTCHLTGTHTSGYTCYGYVAGACM